MHICTRKRVKLSAKYLPGERAIIMKINGPRSHRLMEKEGPPPGHNVPRLPSPQVGRESSARRPLSAGGDMLMTSRSAHSQASRASIASMFSEESRALLLAKMTRKRADEDVIAMQNRINRLKMEEYRAHKNIEDTHSKADDIVRLKAQNELRARAKEKAKKMQEDQLRRERQQLTLERATRDANIRVSLRSSSWYYCCHWCLCLERRKMVAESTGR